MSLLLSPAAVGLITPQLDGVIYLIAQSATFQACVREATAAGAQTHIYWHEAKDNPFLAAPDDELNTIDTRPRAIVNMPHFGRRRQGPGNWFPHGDIYVSFELLIPKEMIDDYRTQSRWFLNQIGQIVQEMTDKSGLDDGGTPPQVFANISKMDMAQPVMPCNAPTEVNYFWGAIFNLGWPN
jgi:hypothetical protein